MDRAHLFSICCVTAIACGGPSGERGQTSADSGDSVSIATPDDSLPVLVTQLWSAEGEFTEEIPVLGGFRGERAPFEALLARADRGLSSADSVVRRLVDCLDRTGSASATWHGQRLSQGMLCYAVLRSIAYYEATEESGGLNGKWDGYVLIDATPAELIVAQQAWRRVVDDGSYVLS